MAAAAGGRRPATGAGRHTWAMPIVGCYPGSFDPVTLGHTDVIERACRLVDKLVIGIGLHPAKAAMVTDAERVDMVDVGTRSIAKATGTAIEIVTFG